MPLAGVYPEPPPAFKLKVFGRPNWKELGPVVCKSTSSIIFIFSSSEALYNNCSSLTLSSFDIVFGA